MRYFTPELWKNLNSTDRSIREAAYCKLEDNRKQYYQYFETIKHFVPQSVIQQIVQNQNFHDYTLTELSFFQSERGRYVCKLEVSYLNKRFIVQMDDIQKVKIDIKTFRHCILGNLAWGYHEFELLKDNNLQLSILCDIENEITFNFNKISIKESSKETETRRRFCCPLRKRKTGD